MKNRLLLLFIVATSILSAQDLVDIVAPVRWYSDNTTYPYAVNSSSSNTRGFLSSAVGHATVATGQMIPEFTVNPANLGMIRFKSFQMSGLFSNTGSNSKNSLNTISYINPIKVYQGSFTWGMTVDRENDYTYDYADDNISQSVSGGLTNWKFAAAMEAIEDVYIGAEAGLLFGGRENDMSFDSPSLISSVGTEGFLEDVNYAGINMTIGLTYQAYKFLNLGVSLNLPKPFSVNHSIRNYGSSGTNFDYSITTPAEYHAGLAFTMKFADLYYSFDYSNWNEISFNDNDMQNSQVDEINREIDDELTNTFSHHFGAALHVPGLPLHLYGGYQYLPNPDTYSSTNILSFSNLLPDKISDRFRSSLSWGASFFMRNGLSLTATFETQYIFQNDTVYKPRNTSISLLYFF